MQDFQIIKDDILKRAKEASACSSEYRRAAQAENVTDLLLVIKDNIAWCIGNKMLDGAYLLDMFGEEILGTNYIYCAGQHEVKIEGANTAYIVALDSSSATVETWGSSSATVKTLDSSSATVKTLDSSSATVETWGSSSATVETWGSSSATVKTLDSSSATVKTWGSSSATVKTWGSSSATVKTLDSSSKLAYSLGDGACPSIKHLNEKKLYVKTTEFTIVQQ